MTAIIVDGETFSTDGPACPFCGFEFTPDEGHYYSESYTEQKCPKCEKVFDVEVYHQTSWTCTQPSDNRDEGKDDE